MKHLILAPALTLTLTLTTPAAALTFDPFAINAVFSQDSFGTTPIDIRFGPVQQIISPELAELDILTPSDDGTLNSPEMNALWALQDDEPNLNMFITEIGPSLFGTVLGMAEFRQTSGYNNSLCAPNGSWGNSFVVDRDVGDFGVTNEVIAHEMGHTLGLYHDQRNNPTPLLPCFGQGVPGNLMQSSVSPGGTDLAILQTATILASPWVQGNETDGLFINVNVFNIVATSTMAPVPLPLPAFLLLAALTTLLRVRRRNTP
mgnify:CR=1 FL=1